MKKEYRIYDPVFEIYLQLFLWYTEKEFCKKIEVDYDWSRDAMYVSINEWCSNWIWVEDLDNIGVISHEVLHLVFEQARTKGIELCRESEEWFTYIHQYFLNRVLDRIEKYKKIQYWRNPSRSTRKPMDIL